MSDSGTCPDCGEPIEKVDHNGQTIEPDGCPDCNPQRFAPAGDQRLESLGYTAARPRQDAEDLVVVRRDALWTAVDELEELIEGGGYRPKHFDIDLAIQRLGDALRGGDEQ